MRNSQVLMQRKAMWMICKEEKKFDEALKAKKARLKSPGKCIVGHALRHNCVETCSIQPGFPKLCMGSRAEVDDYAILEFLKVHDSVFSCRVVRFSFFMIFYWIAELIARTFSQGLLCIDQGLYQPLPNPIMRE